MASLKNVNQNPCNMCMPMGGILPFKGIEQAMVILHGSQGCATYMRRHIAEHFNEPVDVGSSALNEKGTVYGGEKNLKQALDNVIKVYQPKIIGVLTTCLAETIGEDIARITSEYIQEKGLAGFPIVSVPTPGYGGSHSEGYFLALKNILQALAVDKIRHTGINIIVPNISPADIREIKRILNQMKVRYTLFPDISDNMDRPYEKPYQKLPQGGTRLADIARMAGAKATVQFGVTVDEELSPGKYLEDEFGIPLYNLPIPIGLTNTDALLSTIREITGNRIPKSLLDERGRLLDAMIDSHKYNFQGCSVIFGDPELVYAMSHTCIENGIFPVVAATGSKPGNLKRLLEPELAKYNRQADILMDTDFVSIRAKARAKGANVAIGHSDGRYLTEKEGIPLVRMGFPILDRVGGQRILSVGYTGTALFLDRITNTLLDNKLKDYRSTMYKEFYRNYENDLATMES